MSRTQRQPSKDPPINNRFIRALVALLKPLVLGDIGAGASFSDGDKSDSTTDDVT